MRPMRTPSNVTMSRSLKFGSVCPSASAQIGGVERKLRLRHALEKRGLAEIELVIARHENVRPDHVGQRHDVRAVIDPRHQRRRQRVAGMAKITWPPLARSALTTAASRAKPPRRLPSGPPVGHQVDVVDQDEADPRRFCPRRPAARTTARPTRAARLRAADAGKLMGTALRPGGCACLACMQAAPLSRMLAPKRECHERSLAHRHCDRCRAAGCTAAGATTGQDRRAARQSRHAGRRRCRRPCAAISRNSCPIRA